ncbi:unnamed protein product [Calypogeia fissa]
MDLEDFEELRSRQASKEEQIQKEECPEGLEVSVSTLENLGATPGTSTALRRGVTKTRLLTISTSGSCTVQDEPSLSPAADHRVAAAHRKSAKALHNPFPSIGKFKGTAEDKALACILWLKRRGSDKKVKVSKDVLAMYHDSFLYAEVPLTIKVRAAIRGGVFRPLLIWLEFTAALISVIVYVRSTYIINVPVYITIVETVCGVFFLVDYFVNLYSAPVRLYYMFSATGLVDLISVIPVAFVWSREKNFGVEILLFLRVLRIMPMLTSVGLTGATIGQQIFRLVVYAFGVIFIAAGLLQWVDYMATSAEFKAANDCSPKGCITFFGAFYFMIVTISTVGYGDITPRSDWGRVIAILAIVTALIILPVQVNNILQLASRRPYGGYFAVNKVVGSRFIIVSGNLSFRTVQDFLSEFYHPNHDKDMAAFPLRVVLMAPFKPSFELKTLLAHYKYRVEFIQGSPLKDSDLDRVGAKVASAFFLIADQHAQDPDAEDATQILRTLAVHRHCGSQMRVIVELLKPEKRTNAIWDDADQGIEIILKVVILTSRGHFDDHGEVANDIDQALVAPGTSTQDVNNIIIAATVERLLKPVRERIIVELQQEAAFQYLRPKLFIDQRQFFSEMYQRNRVGTFQFAPPYIEGKTFCPQTLAFLMYASFFNRSTVSIVEQLISGGKVLYDNSEGNQVRVLDQIAVPKPYLSQTFGQLFTGLLRRDHVLALGLYRPVTAHGSLVSYVFTNPPPHEPLELKDLVFILR